MKEQLTLGSLFDGQGGWLLAAINNGVKPIWKCEWDKNPSSVSHKHFPDVKQYGDIQEIDPDQLEVVDITCAGSPCQDLSVAGLRKGLDGERSGLFRTAVKLVHRMRERTGGKYPRYFVWENVPGCFTSGVSKGADFKCVLEEIGQVSVPMPANGKWAAAGMAELPTCRIEWRVLDPAELGWLPQRRKRVFLVADFAAPQRGGREILFEQPSLPGNPAESSSQGQGTSGEVRDGLAAASTSVMPFDTTQITSPQNGNRCDHGRPCHTLNANAHVPAVAIKDNPSPADGRSV